MNEKLTIEELQYVQREVELKGKSLGISYLLLILLYPLGVHYAYLQKAKLTVLRVIFTLMTVFSIYPILDIFGKMGTQGTTLELQQRMSSLLVIFGLLILANFIWLIYDLISIPKMTAEFNKKIEDEAGVKTLQARNVIGKIREDEVSKVVIERIMESVYTAVPEIKNKKETLEFKEENTEDFPTISVEESLSLDRGSISVEGYIVGTLKNGVKVTKETLFTNDSVLLIASDPLEKDSNKMLIVQIPYRYQSEFGVKSNPNLKGKVIVTRGKVKKYYGSYGLKDVSNLKLKNNII